MPLDFNRREFVLVAGIGAMSLPLTASAGVRFRQAKPILPWDELRPGVRVTSGRVPGGNVMVVTGGERALVVDSKFASVAGAIVRDARFFAGDAAAPITMVNSHHHGDHTSGNAAFSHAGATMVCHTNAVQRIAEQIDRYRGSAESAVEDARGIDASNLELLAEAKAQVPMAATMRAGDVVPMVAVGATGQITTPPKAMLSHHGPGHTDNDLVIHIPDLDVVHTGDLVFNGLHPFFDPSAGATARGWIESLNAVESLCGDDTVVVPGHGPVGDVTAVRAQREYLEQLIEAVEAAQRAGDTKEATSARTFGFMEGLGFERVRSRAIEAVWDELAG